MPVKALSFKLRKLLGKDRAKWPVTVEIIEKHGERLKEKTDRARRTIDKEKGAQYEFLKSGRKTAPIPQQYLGQDSNGHPKLSVLMVQTDEGPRYAPIEKNLDFESGFEDLDDEAVDMDFIVKLSRFAKVTKNELERHYEITKNENSQWYKAPIVWLVGGAIGMGIFFVLAGIGAQKALTPAAEASSSIIPLLAWKTRQKLEEK